MTHPAHEGDSLHRTVRLGPLLVGDRLDKVIRRGQPVPALDGAAVVSVAPNGKHLLITTDRRAVIHVQLGSDGGWRVMSRAEAALWAIVRADLALITATHVLLARARTVELLQQARALPTRRALGPALLGPEPDWAALVSRARSTGERSVGELLLDPRVASGIGNLWRNEAMFHERLHPDTPLSALDDARLERLYRRARALLRAGRFPKSVYRRHRQPCPVCGARIEAKHVGELVRQVFWCPRCQSADALAGDPGVDPSCEDV